MKSLLKKEIRLLLPAWIVAMVLAVVPVVLFDLEWIASDGRTDSIFYANLATHYYYPVVFSFGLLFLAISCFGQELNSGAFTLLLSQPIARKRIWKAKTTALSLAFISVWLSALAVMSSHFRIFVWDIGNTDSEGLILSPLTFLTVTALATFSGGLWTTLVLRQTTAAFWFTLLIPLVIIVGSITALSHWNYSSQTIMDVITIALVTYSVAGFLFAKRLFLHAQDLQWAGGDITIPWPVTASSKKSTSTFFRSRNRFLALTEKEIQLQQANLIIAVVLLVLQLASCVIQQGDWGSGNPDLQVLLHGVGLLWFLMPLLIGCVAIAEERRAGVMESQLCQPVPRWVQLAVKFLVGLGLSLFFGGGMPLFIGESGNLYGWVFVVAGGIFLVSFYASSFSRTSLQAIGWAAVLGAFLFYQLTVIFSQFSAPFPVFQRYRLSYLRGLSVLELYLGILILALVLAGLAYRNFKWPRLTAKQGWSNFITVLAALVSVYILSSAIYYRAWENFTPAEPAHGPARISNTDEIKFTTQANRLQTIINAAFPDGTVWSKAISFGLVTNPLPRIVMGSVEVNTNGALCYYRYRNDGLENQPCQLGTDAKWKAAVILPGAVWAIRNDGTLWDIYGLWNVKPGRNFTPELQLGHQSDWIGFAGGYKSMALAVSADGGIWSWYPHTDVSWLAPSRKPVYLGNLFQGTESHTHENNH